MNCWLSTPPAVPPALFNPPTNAHIGELPVGQALLQFCKHEQFHDTKSEEIATVSDNQKTVVEQQEVEGADLPDYNDDI